MLEQFTFVGFLLVVALFLGIFLISLSWLLRPKRPSPRKSEIYECGLRPHGEPWVRFKAQYYIFALVFLIFDVEAVFLFPWALAYNWLPFYAVLEGVIFILLLGAALVYVWRKGALEWM
ncbi:MAG TPA: NADH-quinone oxidoreductase subunit A [Anaerolineales bacterium]|nr:NADH-quinone oxidoreductase subunit A [Anaerolineales bacterium]